MNKALFFGLLLISSNRYMKKAFPFLTIVFLSSVSVAAQTPVFIPIKTSHLTQNQQDNTCNFAGTIEVGQFIGQSNDTDLDQIFLCLGDSILIKHHDDANLSGDPDPSSTPGIGYSFYSCPPTTSGPSLVDVLGDPCILPGASSGLFPLSTSNGSALRSRV